MDDLLKRQCYGEAREYARKVLEERDCNDTVAELGGLLVTGRGHPMHVGDRAFEVPRGDMVEGVALLAKAELRGSLKAAFNLSVLFRDGDGVGVDLDRSEELLNKCEGYLKARGHASLLAGARERLTLLRGQSS